MDHAEVVRRVLRGEEVSTIDKINALAEIASEAIVQRHAAQERMNRLEQYNAEAQREAEELRLRIEEAESALRSASEDCHPSVEQYFTRHPEVAPS